MPPFLKKYQVKIGLEIHVQLKTETKLFSSDPISYGEKPNTNLSAYTVGYPGTLPVLNRKALELAVRAGIAFKCEVQKISIFERKNYFYPDMPKGYQITQNSKPLCKSGRIIFFDENNSLKTIGIKQIHLEEDSGKIIHKGNQSLIDLNRCGVPLIEIVTEPSLSTAKEAKLAAIEIQKVLNYTGICEAKMEKGQMRCDVNISVSGDKEEANYKIEIKNLNSFRNIEKAVDYEIDRLCEILADNKNIESETRGFNEEKSTTFFQRRKQNYLEYRYLPEPDLPPLILKQSFIDEVQKSIKTLPDDLYNELLNVNELSVPQIRILTESKELANFFIKVLEKTKETKITKDFFIGPIREYFKNKVIDCSILTNYEDKLACLIKVVNEGDMDISFAKSNLLKQIFKDEDFSVDSWLQQQRKNNEANDSLNEIIHEVVKAYPNEVEKFKNGKQALLGFFMGEILKRSNKNTNRKQLNELLKIYLSEAIFK